MCYATFLQFCIASFLSYCWLSCCKFLIIFWSCDKADFDSFCLIFQWFGGVKLPTLPFHWCHWRKVLNGYLQAHLWDSVGLVLDCCSKWRRRWHPTPVLLPGKSHGRRSLVGCSPWGLKESDMTEWLHFHFSLSCIGEGNGNPLQCSCLENPRDGEPGGLPSMGSHRVGHDWSDLAAAVQFSCSVVSDCLRPHESQHTRLPVPGILQARTREWVAISFSNAWKWKVKVKLLSLVRLFVWPHGLQPTRLLHPWDFPGKNTGVGCHNLYSDNICMLFE